MIFKQCLAAKILAVFTAPAISHQVVFRSYTQELARLGHEVLVVTTDLAFPKGDTPKNLTEIDIHNLTYSALKSYVPSFKMGEGVTIHAQIDRIFAVINDIGGILIASDEIKKLQGQHFDLLIVEAMQRIALPLSHMLQVPVIQISSFGTTFDYETVGAPCHPVFYPELTTQRIRNLTMFEKIREIFVNAMVKNNRYNYDEKYDIIMKQVMADVPTTSDLRNRVTTLMLNVQSIWEENRPVPIGVSYISGIYKIPIVPLPKDIKTYLDSSRNGVIYVSFETKVVPSRIPQDRIQVLLNVLAKLPYDILLKWDHNDLPGKPANVKVGKWFPQPSILNHPKIKLFITQCGLQSTEEAIDAGVPMIGIPFFFDQWANAEKYVRHKIGLKVEIETMTEDKLRLAIETVINDRESYRNNIARLRTYMRDQPHSPMKRAIWWTEYASSHSGAAHLKSPAANMPIAEYLELELVFIVLSVAVISLYSMCALAFTFLRFCLNRKVKTF